MVCSYISIKDGSYISSDLNRFALPKSSTCNVSEIDIIMSRLIKRQLLY